MVDDLLSQDELLVDEVFLSFNVILYHEPVQVLEFGLEVEYEDEM